MEVNKICFILFLLFIGGSAAYGQTIGVQTNSLYLLSSTPNLGVEVKLAPKFTMAVSIGYNPFDFSQRFGASETSNPKLHHWSVAPEGKFWFCQSFERAYLGVHALYGEYNCGGFRWPAFQQDFRYRGLVAGGGAGIGYQWALGKRWGLDIFAGIGYLFFDYDKFKAGRCGEKLGHFVNHCIGPTKLAVTFTYYIN